MRTKNHITASAQAGRILLLSLLYLFFLNAEKSPGQVNTDKLAEIENKFTTYCRAVPREEVYLHTDREEYIAGEDLWLKAYVTDRQTGKPSPYSRIVYLELFNADNQPVASRRLQTLGGSGPGHISLPDTLTSGSYTLRAYTNWMKNFFPSNCFIKKINIFNALRTGSFMVGGEVSAVLSEDQGEAKRDDRKDILDVTVKRSTGSGRIISVSADSDYTLNNGSVCYVIIQTRGNINFSGTIRLSGDTADIRVAGGELDPGINQVTLFNSSGSPVAEKYIFTPSGVRGETPISISGGPGAREHVSLGGLFSTGNSQGEDLSGLSISVSPVRSFSDQGIADYMVFGSEFGILPRQLMSRPKDEIPESEMDDFLKSVRSSWINWDQIMSGEIPPPVFDFEKENHFIYGKIVSSGSGTPVPDHYVFMSKPGKTPSFQYARSDSSGFFSLNLPMSGGVQDIIIQPEQTGQDNRISLISAFSDFIPAEGGRKVTVDSLPEQIREWSTNFQVRKIYGIASTSDSASDEIMIKPLLRFYGKPDASVNMDDFIKLPVMQEVFFELLPGVMLRERKSSFEVTIYDLAETNMDIRQPGILIDGVIVSDASVLAGLDPDVVERIEVVKEPYMVGSYIFYGIVSIITRKGDFSSVNLPDYAVRLLYGITSRVPSFIAPEYSSRELKESSIPDFRNTLYWNPSLKPGDDGQIRTGFWTSDYPSDYIINIQGTDKEGRPLSIRQPFGQEN
ncbi:MAG: hypothetical protein MUE74_10360 [Bacteroidales bacterium]|nr:hypothetical protein [Bacteroidales bacterium]